MVYLLSGFENSDNADIYYQRTKSTLFSFLVWHKLIYFPFGLLLPLTFVGIYLKRNDFNKLLPVYIFLVAYIPSIVLFLVTARHRLPLIPFMIIIASAGIVSLVKEKKQPRTKQIIVSLIIFVITLLIFNRTYYNEGRGSGYQIHYNNGIKYEQLKDYVKAEKEYKSAANLNPLSPTLLNNLAYVQYLLKKYEQADKNYHRALKLKPNFSRAYNNLGLLVAAKGNPDSALKLFQKAVTTFNPAIYSSDELSKIYLNLADTYDQTQHFDSADIYYQKALKAEKQYYQAYFDAAAFYARQGKYKLTDSLYAAGRHLHDLSASDLFNWGLSLLQRQQFAASVGMMFRALKRDDSLYQAYYCIAVGYYQQNYPIDSVKKYLDLCFRYNPNYRPALELQKTLLKNK
ncbi:MAG: tetratricopeptide repeat protein [FCB group bacterium]|nr:tetratricopeptide repeat protein [FCB group bacterium]